MTTARSLFIASTLSLLACRNAPAEPAAPAQIHPPLLGEPSHQGLPPGHPPINNNSGAGANGPGVAPPEPSADEHPLRWTDPPGWRSVRPASSMRRAQYAVPGAGGDGELAVFFFGVGQGGDIDENIRRWHGQFERTDAPPTRETRTVGTMRVTITAATGRFNAGGMTAAPAGPRDDYALLGAIVETPQGPWFFKLTGPRATITAARPAFDALVASMRW